VIALPEGCILTKKDFEELLAFQRKDHVDVWYEIQITGKSFCHAAFCLESFLVKHTLEYQEKTSHLSALSVQQFAERA